MGSGFWIAPGRLGLARKALGGHGPRQAIPGRLPRGPDGQAPELKSLGSGFPPGRKLPRIPPPSAGSGEAPGEGVREVYGGLPRNPRGRPKRLTWLVPSRRAPVRLPRNIFRQLLGGTREGPGGDYTALRTPCGADDNSTTFYKTIVSRCGQVVSSFLGGVPEAQSRRRPGNMASY